MIIIHWIS